MTEILLKMTLNRNSSIHPSYIVMKIIALNVYQNGKYIFYFISSIIDAEERSMAKNRATKSITNSYLDYDEVP